MVARNAGLDVVRIYALDRIQGLDPTDNRYAVPKDFDPETYFYNCFGIIKDDNAPAEIIRIKVRNNQGKFVRSLPLHHSQHKDIPDSDSRHRPPQAAKPGPDAPPSPRKSSKYSSW